MRPYTLKNIDPCENDRSLKKISLRGLVAQTFILTRITYPIMKPENERIERLKMFSKTQGRIFWYPLINEEVYYYNGKWGQCVCFEILRYSRILVPNIGIDSH